MPRSEDIQSLMDEIVRPHDKDTRALRHLAVRAWRHDSPKHLSVYFIGKDNLEIAKILVTWERFINSEKIQDIYLQVCTNNLGAEALLLEEQITERNREIKQNFEIFVQLFYESILPVFKLYGWTPPEIFDQTNIHPKKFGSTPPTEAVAKFKRAYDLWFAQQPGKKESVRRWVVAQQSENGMASRTTQDLPDLRGATSQPALDSGKISDEILPRRSTQGTPSKPGGMLFRRRGK